MNRYRILQLLFRAAFAVLFKLDVTGLENVPPNGPFFIAVNHLTILDPVIVFVVMPAEKMYPLAAKKWESTFWVGALLKMLDTIFINRQQIDRQAIKKCVTVLKDGGIIGIAPEGTRSKTGGLIRAKPGVAYVAARAKVPILPIGVSGQSGYMQKLMRFKRPLIQVHIGSIIRLPPVKGRDKGSQFQEQADQIMITIGKLIDPELRGVYASAIELDLSTPNFTAR